MNSSLQKRIKNINDNSFFEQLQQAIQNNHNFSNENIFKIINSEEIQIQSKNNIFTLIYKNEDKNETNLEILNKMIEETKMSTFNKKMNQYYNKEKNLYIMPEKIDGKYITYYINQIEEDEKEFQELSQFLSETKNQLDDKQTNKEITQAIEEIHKSINGNDYISLESKITYSNTKIKNSKELKEEDYNSQPIEQWEIFYTGENNQQNKINLNNENLYFDKIDLESYEITQEFINDLKNILENITVNNLFEEEFYNPFEEIFSIDAKQFTTASKIKELVEHYENVEKEYKKLLTVVKNYDKNYKNKKTKKEVNITKEQKEITKIIVELHNYIKENIPDFKSNITFNREKIKCWDIEFKNIDNENRMSTNFSTHELSIYHQLTAKQFCKRLEVVLQEKTAENMFRKQYFESIKDVYVFMPYEINSDQAINKKIEKYNEAEKNYKILRLKLNELQKNI